MLILKCIVLSVTSFTRWQTNNKTKWHVFYVSLWIWIFVFMQEYETIRRKAKQCIKIIVLNEYLNVYWVLNKSFWRSWRGVCCMFLVAFWGHWSCSDPWWSIITPPGVNVSFMGQAHLKVKGQYLGFLHFEAIGAAVTPGDLSLHQLGSTSPLWVKVISRSKVNI